MACISAIGVDNDFSSGKSRITLRAAYNKSACWIYIVFCIVRKQLFVNGGLYNLSYYILAYLLKRNIGRMLR